VIRGHTVIVITPGSVTERGVTFPDWDTATDTTYADCRVQPLKAEELTDFARQGTKDWRRLFGPVGMLITAACRVTYDGDTYEVESVEPWPSPTGALAHTEAVIYRTDG